LSVLVWTLVDRYAEHRPKCAACAGPELCPHVQTAIGEVIEWWKARRLLSEAIAYRIQQDFIDGRLVAHE